MTDLLLTAALILAAGWMIGDTYGVRDENRRLRREMARLTNHPSTYQPEPEPLPYMRRYADDE